MKKLLSVFKAAALRFYEHNPLRLSGATAFFSIFAIPPIVILLSGALGLFSGYDFTERFFNKLGGIVGNETVDVLRKFQTNVASGDNNIFYTIGSAIFLIFIATNLFNIVQQSLNELYAVEERKSNVVTNLIDRAIGFTFILFTGLLFLITLLADTALVLIGDYITAETPLPGAPLIQAANMAASFLISCIWFAVIIEFLPALRIHWKAICAGSLVTSILFVAGKNVLNLAVLNARIRTVYETSASSVLLLIFVFFIALIIYYGACFTIEFALHYGLRVHPKRFAFYAKKREQ